MESFRLRNSLDGFLLSLTLLDSDATGDALLMFDFSLTPFVISCLSSFLSISDFVFEVD